VSASVDARSLLRFLARLERWWPEELRHETISFSQNLIMIPVSVKPPIRMKIPMKGDLWLCNIFKHFKEFEKQCDSAVENRVVLDMEAFIETLPYTWIGEFFLCRPNIFGPNFALSSYNLTPIVCQ